MVRRGRGARVRMGLSGLFLLGLASSCGELSTETGTCPACGLGQIEGQVRGPDGPVQATIEIQAVADAAPGGNETRYSVSGQTDSSGVFAFAVPRGRYVVTAESRTTRLYYSARRLSPDRADADTLLVGQESVHADFLGGGLTIRLEVPPELERSWIGCSIEPRPTSAPSPAAFAAGEVRGGTFEVRFPWLPGGSTYVASVAGAALGRAWLPATFDRSRADTLAVIAGTMTYHESRLDAPALVSGEILGSWQTMEATSPSVALMIGPQESVSTGWTDERGRFFLNALGLGPVRLRVRIEGVESWIGGSSFEDARVFDLRPGDRVTDISLVESGIFCQFEGPGTSPWRSGALRLIDAGGRQILPDMYSHVSGVPVKLANLRPGAYYLQVTPDDARDRWRAQWYDRQDSLSTATPIWIREEGETVPITVRLEFRR